MRNMAKVQTPTVEISSDGDQVTLRTITTFKTQEIKFKLGEEFEEKRLDGATVKSKVTLENGKLLQHQEADTPCDIIREIEGDKLKTVRRHSALITFASRTFVQVCKCGDVVSTRIYKRV